MKIKTLLTESLIFLVALLSLSTLIWSLNTPTETGFSGGFLSGLLSLGSLTLSFFQEGIETYAGLKNDFVYLIGFTFGAIVTLLIIIVTSISLYVKNIDLKINLDFNFDEDEIIDCLVGGSQIRREIIIKKFL